MLSKVVAIFSVRKGPERPERSWNFSFNIFWDWKFLKKGTGPRKSWKSAKLKQLSFQNLRYEKCIQTIRRIIDFEILGMKGFEVKFGVVEK